MFGKPNWYRLRRAGWGLTPIRWQGWVHATVWGVAVFAPLLALLFARGPLEAIIWAAASSTALLLEMRQLRSAIRTSQAGDILIIDNEVPDDGEAATARYELQWRGARR